jgi:hypothetical protein
MVSVGDVILDESGLIARHNDGTNLTAATLRSTAAGYAGGWLFIRCGKNGQV